MTNFTEVVIDAIINRTMEENEFKCRYCGRNFRRESTLTAHVCEPKRRAQQEKDVGVQLGLQSYLRFYELTQGSAKLKGYQDFCESPYYNAFVKFGRHMVSIKAINTKGFIDHVINTNKKLDQWCKDKHYEEFLYKHLRKENVKDALERSINTMTTWAEENDSVFNHFFLYANTNKATHLIQAGRISSWIIYNCDSGIAFMDKLNDEQIQILYPYIDPEFWKRKFVDYMADTEWVKHILKEAKL